MCEVMLRDMTDSKRIDQHIQSQKVVGAFDSLFVTQYDLDTRME